MELTSVLTIFKEFRDWLLGIDKATLEHSKEEKAALKSLYIALAETKAYFADRKTLPHDRDRERQISRLWFDAASELKRIDINLAERCFVKGDYWTNPDNWQQDEGEKLTISIEEMTSLSRKHLVS